MTATAVLPDSDGSVTPAAGSPILTTFTDDDNNGGFFQYTGRTASPAASDPGLVFIDRDDDPDLNGAGFGEIPIGSDGFDNDIEAFEGDDVLIGGTGDDDLDGGDGDDLIFGGGGDTVDGDDGNDTFMLPGDRADFTVTRAGGTYTIVENAAGDTDTVSDVESFDFNGTIFDATTVPDFLVAGAGPGSGSPSTGGTRLPVSTRPSTC